MHRLAARLSQIQLAQSIGVTVELIRRYEKGERVSFDRLTAIARTLNMPIGRFVEGPASLKRNSNPRDVEIGRRIRACRSVAGLSQVDLGMALMVTPQLIARYETGAESVDADRLARIAQVLKIPVRTLLGEHDSVERDERGASTVNR
jgi:transcriptional regulator with XRE-family HTH domain